MTSCSHINFNYNNLIKYSLIEITCLLDNDILCLTETQCEAGSDTLIIQSAFQKKNTMHFNNSNKKFKSIAYGLSNAIEILVKEHFNGISIANI